MEENYRKIEDILENPGIFVFKLENQKITFPEKKYSSKYENKDVIAIKTNIIRVFQTISENVEKYKDKNPEYLGHIVKNLNSKYNNLNRFNFPGLQVINMDREKLNFFTHYPERFLLCEKSDGVRYLLIQYNNGICHLVARNLEFFEIYISEKLPPSGIKGDWSIDYLLDGELVLDDVNEEMDDKTKFIKFKGENKKINFLIFDAVVIKGYNYGFLCFWQRLEEFNKLFMKEYDISKYIKNCAKSFASNVREELNRIKIMNKNSQITFPNPGKLDKKIKELIPGTVQTSNANNKSITLYMKDYYKFTQIKKLNELIKLLPHHNDGLIINVDDYPYYSGQSCEVFKWKPIEMNTIDFEIKFNEDKKRYLLCVVGSEGDGINNSILKPVEILCFESDDEKKNFIQLYAKYENKLIAECFYDPNICSKEVAINNYYLSKIKNEKNDIIPFDLGNLPNDINTNIETLKGGWRFQRLRNDKSSANYIYTYQNIKVCIKENLHMEEIISTVDENLKIVMDKNNEERIRYVQDLKKEYNIMSALVWKKFFKINKKDDLDEFDDLDFNNESNKEEKKSESLLNKKRNKPDEESKNEDSENKVDDENNRDEDDLNDEDNFDKMLDDDYGDDFC